MLINHQEAKNLSRFWIKLPRIFQSEFMLYMYHVAEKLHKETVSSNSYNNCLNWHTKHAASCIPRSLYAFLRLLCTGKDPAEYEDDDLSVHRCVSNFAQCMMFGPSYMGLGLSIHQALRSKEFVNLLNAAGHCAVMTRFAEWTHQLPKINRRSWTQWVCPNTNKFK